MDGGAVSGSLLRTVTHNNRHGTRFGSLVVHGRNAHPVACSELESFVERSFNEPMTQPSFNPRD